MACVILPFISNPLPVHGPSIAGVVRGLCTPSASSLGIVTILLNLADLENRLPISSSMFHLMLSQLSVLLYIGALVLWALYQFDESLVGSPRGPGM